MTSAQSTTVSVTVRQFGGAWKWAVTQVNPLPIQDLGVGSAPSSGQAWADAASVVNDQGEE